MRSDLTRITEMSTTLTLEERLANLEKDMADLKHRAPPNPPKVNWLEKVAGTFKDDSEFGEILRLGREIRREDSPANDNGAV